MDIDEQIKRSPAETASSATEQHKQDKSLPANEAYDAPEAQMPAGQGTYVYVQKKLRSGAPKPYEQCTAEEQALWQQLASKWVWPAIFSMIKLKDFNPSLKAIAARLHIGLSDCIDAVEGLERLGLIRRKAGGGFEQAYDRILIPNHEDIKPYIKQGLMMSAVDVSSRVNNASSRIHCAFVPTTREHYDEYVRKINEVTSKFVAESIEKEAEEVFAVSICGASLTPPDLTNRWGEKDEEIQ